MDESKIRLSDGERMEPLDSENVIIQSVDGYRFGSDSVALAHFAAERLKKGARVFDLCSGCGIIGIMLAIEGFNVDGAEIDRDQWDRSVRSVGANQLDNACFYNADIKELGGFERASYHGVVCNPPFYKASAYIGKNAQANAELTVTLSDVAAAARRLLRVNGSFFLVYTAERLDEAMTLCTQNDLFVKELAINKNCKTFMLRAVKGAKRGMNVIVKEY